jgi:hypothetical protein
VGGSQVESFKLKVSSGDITSPGPSSSNFASTFAKATADFQEASSDLRARRGMGAGGITSPLNQSSLNQSSNSGLGQADSGSGQANLSLERRGMANKTLTPTLSQRERGGNTTDKKTAEGSAIDLLTSQVKQRPELVIQSPSGSTTLQEKLYQENNIGANNGQINQKPSQKLGLVDSNVVFESELPSANRVTQDINLVKSNFQSGGDEGIRTPRAMNGNSDSALRRPYSNELYHTPAQTSQNRFNIQDILKDRSQNAGIGDVGGGAGLSMGGSQVSSLKLKVPSGDTGDITSPGPSSARRGMGTQNNPLPEKKLVVPQNAQSKQTEIDRKLEELGKRAGKNN